MDTAVQAKGKIKAQKDSTSIRPFLKWAGNKYRIIDKIKPLLPEGKRLIEPFAGSGALFLNSDYPAYLLCDTNADLIHLYEIIKQEGRTFIQYCKRYFNGSYNNADSYYAQREQFNQINNRRKKAALFLYLNRHGYNGLCRYNKKGGYNVPFGRYTRPYFPEKEMLFFHHKAQSANFKVCSFEESFKLANKDDVIYCDPPYAPLSDTANFTDYSAGGFDLSQQLKLAELAEQHRSNKGTVLISNHDTDFTRKAYQQADTHRHFKVRRNISCKGQKRKMAEEVLALYRS
ncbi:Methyl-directed repair DNA adenine methylase [hydrothermal vent metagenome]|uniref:site-specific DNA-methyltransferase (adenine-specific) n=1 Tax=hydrothermal vent metagenome TaxID=652676 RepID=A0A3B1AYM1_9ZZZZ